MYKGNYFNSRKFGTHFELFGGQKIICLISSNYNRHFKNVLCINMSV